MLWFCFYTVHQMYNESGVWFLKKDPNNHLYGILDHNVAARRYPDP